MPPYLFPARVSVCCVERWGRVSQASSRLAHTTPAHTGLVWNWLRCWHTASWLTHYVPAPHLLHHNCSHWDTPTFLWLACWRHGGGRGWVGGLKWPLTSDVYQIQSGWFYRATTLGRFFGWWWGWGRWLISLQHIPCGTHSTGSPFRKLVAGVGIQQTSHPACINVQPLGSPIINYINPHLNKINPSLNYIYPNINDINPT